MIDSSVVQFQNATIGAITDENGRYKIEMDSNLETLKKDTLDFLMIGYETQSFSMA